VGRRLIPPSLRSVGPPLIINTYAAEGTGLRDGSEKLQWAETLYVVHGRRFGHKIFLATQTQGHEPQVVVDWSWRGLGVPPEVVRSVQAYAGAVAQEHLVMRYGVADLGQEARWPYEDSPTF
jgi:hypothetical protein